MSSNPPPDSSLNNLPDGHLKQVLSALLFLGPNNEDTKRINESDYNRADIYFKNLLEASCYLYADLLTGRRQDSYIKRDNALWFLQTEADKRRETPNTDRLITYEVLNQYINNNSLISSAIFKDEKPPKTGINRNQASQIASTTILSSAIGIGIAVAYTAIFSLGPMGLLIAAGVAAGIALWGSLIYICEAVGQFRKSNKVSKRKEVADQKYTSIMQQFEPQVVESTNLQPDT